MPGLIENLAFVGYDYIDMYVDCMRKRVPMVERAVQVVSPFVLPALKTADLYVDAAYSKIEHFLEAQHRSVEDDCLKLQGGSKMFRVHSTNNLRELERLQRSCALEDGKLCRARLRLHTKFQDDASNDAFLESSDESSIYSSSWETDSNSHCWTSENLLRRCVLSSKAWVCAWLQDGSCRVLEVCPSMQDVGRCVSKAVEWVMVLLYRGQHVIARLKLPVPRDCHNIQQAVGTLIQYLPVSRFVGIAKMEPEAPVPVPAG